MDTQQRQQLQQLQRHVEEHLQCPLKQTATNMVYGAGGFRKSVMFIGEAPGAKEDAQGVPFVGASGAMLDTLLNTIHWTRDDIYIANILKYRPPNNSNPTIQQIQQHTPYLIRQIDILRPTIICTLGNFATRFIVSGCRVDAMHTIQGITQLHGTFQTVTIHNTSYRVLPLYHPAALLYRRSLLSQALQDIALLECASQ